MLRGKMVIGQSGGPTVVINQSLVGAVLAAREEAAIRGILGARHGIAGIMNEEFVDLTTTPSEAELERVAATPAAALGSVRLKPGREECARVFEVFRKHDVRYLFYIGGNDSAETADIINRIASEAGYALRTVHIPKTIDNDLRVTDHSPGFPSAARFVALAFLGDDRDNAALAGVKINVVMGRHAGFLTAASALARQREGDGPHLIYLPERPFDPARFQEDVRRVYRARGRCVVAVSEGVADADSNPIATTGERDSHGNVQLSGSGMLGDRLAALAREAFGGEKVRVRADTFGYLQRSFPGVVSEIDAREARRVGAFAVRRAVAGADGSVAIRRITDDPYDSDCFMTPLSSVARTTTCMRDGWISEEGNDVTDAWLDYLRPLVGPLPVMGRL
ncbi:MAG: 6-phosphofructokinase [Zetaproteobacteria bacterium]|nr:MAG: 6-phosphofructokinase [Zetaproteobacteria bacterium]